MDKLVVAILTLSLVGTSTFKEALSTVSTQAFDVTKFGAVGDGHTDDANAFESTWKAACKAEADSVTITAPSGKNFSISPVQFGGPCKARAITFEILGCIVAPPRSAWSNKRPIWISFTGVNGLSVVGKGQGLIDGRGDTWGGVEPALRPLATQYTRCNNLLLQGYKQRNSQKVHITLNSCNEVVIEGLDIEAPLDSVNTDGISVSSANVHIRDTKIYTGDDCVAIKGGAKYINVSNIVCSGHGISIGSLGRTGSNDKVEEISVKDCIFDKSATGVRIKTWQGGSGYAKNISFTNITFIETKNPIIIDQHYCPHSVCPVEKSAVNICNVNYSQFHGTTVSEIAINLNCSQAVPCTNIDLRDIDIKPAFRNFTARSYANNVHGKAFATIPKVSLLR